MNEFSIARQPILDASLQLYAYELLFRGHKKTEKKVSFTSEVLATAIFDIGLNKATGNNFAFINMSYEDIMSPTIDSLPTEKIVLELLEDIKIDDPLVQRVQELSALGFTIALDDFVYSSEWEPLIEVASIIKLDLTVLSDKENLKIINKLKNRGIKFLAEKVETYEEYQLFKEMGCEYFQGYFLCKPEILKGKSLTAGPLAKARLLAEINNPNISVDEVASIIQQDTALAFKLLKYLNSAHFSFAIDIESINQAVVMIGIQGIKKWSTLLCLRGLSAKPSELIKVSLTRAYLAEKSAPNNESNTYFLAGLFSTLDALLDSEIESVLSSIPLDTAIKNALTTQDGDLGVFIKQVIHYEKTALFLENTQAPPFSNEDYLEACEQADEVMSAISAD